MAAIFTFILLFTINTNPPGTIKIKNYFVDKTEIQNIAWLEYIYFNGEGLDSLQLQKLLPDSTNFWYSMPANRFKPIVLITYEQALGYCEWRSKAVSENLGIKITYRLPTTTEWNEIAEEVIKTDHRQIKRGLKKIKKMIKKDSIQYTLTGIQGPESKIYNMFDNVSEMTLQKGIAMGANNYDMTDLKTNLTRLIKYDSPNTYLGFRCIAEIEETN